MQNLTDAVMQEQNKKKPGRPVVAGSARQQKLQERLEKGNDGKLGRPVVEGSARQQKIAEMVEKIKSGVEIKRGRPKGTTNGSSTGEKKKSLTIKQLALMQLGMEVEANEETPTEPVVADGKTKTEEPVKSNRNRTGGSKN